MWRLPPKHPTKHYAVSIYQVPIEDMDGHRAPVYELLSQTSRSVDTQTPNHGSTDIFSDPLPIMLEVNELVGRSDSQGSEDNSACSSRGGGESEERSQSDSPFIIAGTSSTRVTVWMQLVLRLPAARSWLVPLISTDFKSEPSLWKGRSLVDSGWCLSCSDYQTCVSKMYDMGIEFC